MLQASLVSHDADNASRVTDREGHLLSCDVLRGYDQVALILPVVTVHDHDELIAFERRDRLLN